jgi:hypothetical protein
VELSDRTVHAELDGVGQVVRYDRAGKWYYEPPVGRRRALTIKQAVDKAAEMVSCGGKVYLKRPGGSTFDAFVARKGIRR